MPQLSCKGAILIDDNTSQVLYQKNADTEIAPASTTKIMTCLLVLEKLKLSDKVVIPREATNFLGNNIDLKKGEVFTVKELLYALMIHSANDAAVALAIRTSGSVSSFCSLMNKRAKQLGAYHTNFITPNGFTNSSQQHTTARDLATIASYAMIQEEVHRFAVEYHRGVRSRNALKSVLDEIDGIGPKKRNALLSYFGGVDEIKKADIQELSKVEGITAGLAEKIKDFFSREKTSPGDDQALADQSRRPL